MALVEDVALAHFADRVGETFGVETEGGRLEMVLDFVTELPRSPRPGGAFRLDFLGPREPLLPQGIYGFEIDEDRFDLFIVATGQSDINAQYEAVFY